VDRVINDEQTAAMAGYLSTVPEVVLGFLFGSYARGQGRPDSDVDCAVLLADVVPSGVYFDARLRLIDGLARATGRDDVDVAILNEAPLALAYRVLRDGKLLFCRAHAAYVQYRVRTLNLYFDFAPLLERHQAMFLKRVSDEGILYGYGSDRGAAETKQKLAEALALIAEARKRETLPSDE
jgi:predicted nucleotidyltransferase